MKTSSTHAFVNQLLVYTLVMIGFSGSIGLGTVWLRHQISLTANATKVLDARIAELDRQVDETTTAIETERDPQVLLQRNADWHLGLVLAIATIVAIWHGARAHGEVLQHGGEEARERRDAIGPLRFAYSRLGGRRAKTRRLGPKGLAIGNPRRGGVCRVPFGSGHGVHGRGGVRRHLVHVQGRRQRQRAGGIGHLRGQEQGAQAGGAQEGDDGVLDLHRMRERGAQPP